MELGSAVLRRSALNSLFRALHPRHGLVWTDGQNVFLSPVSVQGENLRQSNPIKLGEFDSIQGLCWSCDFPDSWCYLCVTQYQKVSIWRVEGNTPNLKLKLVRKISKNPLPQGCLWNPMRDILAIATSEQCSIYFRHSDKKSSLSLPIQTQSRDGSQQTQLRSACWSSGGDQLYVATKSTIWIFSWSSIDTRIKEFAADEHPVTGADGSILTMVAIGKDYILLTKELPLENLCKQDALTVDMSEAVKSPTDTLMNLRSGDAASSAAASLMLLAKSGNQLNVVSSASLHGLLAPDLLCYSVNGSSQFVVVGSNTQCTLQFYTISGFGSLDRQHDIMLPDDQRPKGLGESAIPHSVYILVGKTKKEDSAFLSLSKESSYEIKLNLTKLYPAENPVQQVSGGAAAIISQSDSYETISENSFKISNLPIASAPVIEELSPPRSSNIGTLPKINNSAVETNQKESNLIRELSSSQPHLNSSKTQANQSGAMSSRNNQSADSLPDTNQSNDEMNLGEKRDEFSSYPHLKIQNDVNEEGRSISAKDTKSSWRNITKSDDSFVHNHHESALSSPVQRPTDREPVTSSPAAEYEPTSHTDSTEASSGSHDHTDDIDDLTHLLTNQDKTISKLRRRIDELSNMLEECHMISVNNYQDLNNPEVVSVRFKSVTNGVDSEERKFLLDKGRLQLDVVKAAFGVPYLVLNLDGLPIVLTSNIDGYIPLKFEVGGLYHMSCEAASPGNALISSNTRHQSDTSRSPGAHNLTTKSQPSVNYNSATESPQQHTEHQLTSIDDNKSSGSSSGRPAAAASTTGTHVVHIDPRTAKLKALINNDKSGNAMRRLQAAAANINSGSSSAKQQQSNGVELSGSAVAALRHTDTDSQTLAATAVEPRKPPRRGNNKKSNRSDDSSDPANSFMDVTAAV